MEEGLYVGYNTEILAVLTRILVESNHSFDHLIEALHLDFGDDQNAFALADALETAVDKELDTFEGSVNDALAAATPVERYRVVARLSSNTPKSDWQSVVREEKGVAVLGGSEDHLDIQAPVVVADALRQKLADSCIIEKVVPHHLA